MAEDLSRSNALRLLVRHARTRPTAVAFRSKHLGLYRERTWRDYAVLVARVAAGLKRLGVTRGERVAIMGDPCEEWMLADLGAQALGAITYGVYPTASASEVEYQLRDAGASVFVAQDQEYVDRILPFADRLPALRFIVVVDTSAMFSYAHPKLRGWDEVLGEPSAADEDLVALEALAAAIDPGDPAFIVYTSGTTGHPKGALVAHGRHLAGAFNLVQHYPLLAEPQRTVVFLPLCHVLGRDVALTLPLLSGLVPHFGEDAEDLTRTIFEVAPTVLFTVPRYLQKFASRALVAVQSASRPKRLVYDWAMRVGRRHVRAHWEGRASGTGRLAYALARAVAFRPLLNKLGFDALELVISGGAPLPPETMALWQMWGVNVVEIYGQTETAGAIISGQRGPYPRPGNVGAVPAGWAVKLADDGEILVRSGDVFDGYWHNEAATAQAFDADGWLRTGDVGRLLDDGALQIIDRARDFIVTAGGKTLSPSFIENQLRASPYVAEAMVIGHARKYLSALIEIDFDSVADWARSEEFTYAGFTSLAQHPRVQRLLQGEVDRVNSTLSRVEQIKSFRILPKALDPEEEGEPVTPTRKLKRARMLERFSSLVEAMYDDSEERRVAAGVGDVLPI